MIWAAGLAISVMSATWLVARQVNNYSLVDPVWAFLLAGVTALLAALGSGWAPRRAVIAILVGSWGLRLGHHLLRRVINHHPREDGRYRDLRAEYGAHVGARFFVFFQIQALSILGLAVPFYLIAQNSRASFSVVEWSGLGIWVLAFIGEVVADRQLAAFKAAHPGKTCDRGLWACSRHPNYFFEACLWWAYFLIALDAEYGVYTLYAPLTMLLLLLKVTGVPPAEAQSLRSRGAEFEAYQRRVSKFVPWFPKRGAR